MVFSLLLINLTPAPSNILGTFSIRRNAFTSLLAVKTYISLILGSQNLQNYQVKRKKVLLWKRREFLKRIEGIKEPSPKSIQDENALALNSVYRKNFQNVSISKRKYTGCQLSSGKPFKKFKIMEFF